MSATLFWAVIFPIAYVVMGIGTARAVLTERARYVKRRDGYARPDEDDVALPALFGGILWPLALVYLLLIRPVIVTVGPGFVRWFTAPARKAGGS